MKCPQEFAGIAATCCRIILRPAIKNDSSAASGAWRVGITAPFSRAKWWKSISIPGRSATTTQISASFGYRPEPEGTRSTNAGGERAHGYHRTENDGIAHLTFPPLRQCPRDLRRCDKNGRHGPL